MANALYDLGREKFLGGDLDWDAHALDVWLMDAADYVKNLTTDEWRSILTVGGRVAQFSDLASKTKTLGVADAADITFTAVSGDISEELVIDRDTAVEGTSPLICNIDTATGLPITPNSGDIDVLWDSGANKIFKL